MHCLRTQDGTGAARQTPVWPVLPEGQLCRTAPAWLYAGFRRKLSLKLEKRRGRDLSLVLVGQSDFPRDLLFSEPSLDSASLLHPYYDMQS